MLSLAYDLTLASISVDGNFKLEVNTSTGHAADPFARTFLDFELELKQKLSNIRTQSVDRSLV